MTTEQLLQGLHTKYRRTTILTLQNENKTSQNKKGL